MFRILIFSHFFIYLEQLCHTVHQSATSRTLASIQKLSIAPQLHASPRKLITLLNTAPISCNIILIAAHPDQP